MMKVMATGALLLTLAASAAHAQTLELEGREVAIYNLAGNIRIERGTGNNTVVQVTPAGRDARRLTVAADRINGRHTLRVLFPGDQVVVEGLQRGTSTDIRVNEDGTFGGDGRRVRIRTGEGDRDALHARADMVVRVPAGVTLNAHLGVGEINAGGVQGNLDLETSAGEIVVADLTGRLDAESASGGISARNVNGDLELESASGGIHVENAQAQSIEIEVASGGITVDGARAQSIELETASGSIRVRGATTPDLNAESASGSVVAELAGEIRSVEIETASGSAEVAVPANFAGEVELETASGGIDVDFPMNITSRRRNQVSGTIGSGGTGRISMSTASGNVRIRRQ
jgi:hypothetical protein